MKLLKAYPNPQVLQESNVAILVYKPLGFTPFEAISYIKDNFPKYKNVKMGYAGRLDPMAEGVLLILLKEANSNKDKFEQYDKEYKFECTFGIETDTLDILGEIAHVDTNLEVNTLFSQLKAELPTLQGDITLPYPIYSSKRVKGKPLFYWARQNKLQDITIPQAKTKILSLRLNNTNTVIGKELADDAIRKVLLVKGDFRQKEIVAGWEKFAEENSEISFPSVSITASVTAGTYIRALCADLGKRLNTVAIATRIERTRIGDYGHLDEFQ